MPARLHIFSAAFIFIFLALQAQPLFLRICSMGENIALDLATRDCSAMAVTDCPMKKCAKPQAEEEDDEKGCGGFNCNPFVPCSMGFCCYLVENFFNYNAPVHDEKKPRVVYDDHRLSSALSECWHPPEMDSYT